MIWTDISRLTLQAMLYVRKENNITFSDADITHRWIVGRGKGSCWKRTGCTSWCNRNPHGQSKATGSEMQRTYVWGSVDLVSSFILISILCKSRPTSDQVQSLIWTDWGGVSFFLKLYLQSETSQPSSSLTRCLCHLLEEAVLSEVGNWGQIATQTIAVLLLDRWT